MRSIFQAKRQREILGRLYALQPDSPRQWGRMTPHQAVCHLADSFRAVLGDRPLPATPPGLRTRWIRFMVFTMPVPWPKGGVPTSPQVDAEKSGTAPAEFAADVQDLESLIRRFVAAGGSLPPHYVWGAMSRREWGRYGYRHVDHHLRQFGC